MPSLSRHLILCLAVVGQCLLAGSLQAAPQLDVRQQDRARLQMDVRTHWQTTMVPAQGMATATPLDAQTVWDWPDARFAAGKAAPVSVPVGERLVGRLLLRVQDSPHSLAIELPMPRLDVVHLSYRYNDGPWTQLTAGDQIPMVQWPFAYRHPVFVIAPKAGELHIVVDIAQPGLFPSPVVLWADPALREEHTVRNLEAAAALALAFINMLICFGAAAIFKRFVFVAVGVYSISIFWVAAGQGGIFGIYLGTTTTWFNDYVKYTSAALFGAVVPWTFSTVVAQKHYAKWVARLATGWLLASTLGMLVMLCTVARATQWAMLSPFLIASLVFGLGIALASVVRSQAHSYLSMAAALLLCAGIFAPIAAYWGYLDGTWSFSVTAVAFFGSTTLLLLTSLLQYRHGNRVIARAEQSPGRDALTGLLNRGVFERRLKITVHSLHADRSHALFMYVALSDAKVLQEQFGGEGFESGMVQMAAVLSSSISIMDTLARVGSNAFGVVVIMPRNAKLANALAQKVITRTMAISSHSVPMAHTARIAMAWMPGYGTQLPELERRAQRVLAVLGSGKRIGWVGGAQAHTDAAPSDEAPASSEPSPRDRNDEVNSVINRLEGTMAQDNLADSKARAVRA